MTAGVSTAEAIRAARDQLLDASHPLPLSPLDRDEVKQVAIEYARQVTRAEGLGDAHVIDFAISFLIGFECAWYLKTEGLADQPRTAA